MFYLFSPLQLVQVDESAQLRQGRLQATQADELSKKVSLMQSHVSSFFLLVVFTQSFFFEIIK